MFHLAYTPETLGSPAHTGRDEGGTIHGSSLVKWVGYQSCVYTGIPPAANGMPE